MKERGKKGRRGRIGEREQHEERECGSEEEDSSFSDSLTNSFTRLLSIFFRYGWSLLGMILSSLALQLAVVVIQNKHNPKRLAVEICIVLTGLKPGFDAYAVCSSKEMESHHVFDAKSELGECASES